MPGDLIQVSKEQGDIRIMVFREGDILFLGEDCEIGLRTRQRMTALSAWAIVDLILKANWILVDVIQQTRDDVRAKVRRIATCSVEMDPRLPSGDAGGDGFGRG